MRYNLQLVHNEYNGYGYNVILSFSSSQCKVFLYHALLKVSAKHTPSRNGLTEKQNQSDS